MLTEMELSRHHSHCVGELDGNKKVYEQLKTTLVQFELGFEMMPGTKKVEAKPDMSTFEQMPPAYNGD